MPREYSPAALLSPYGVSIFFKGGGILWHTMTKVAATHATTSHPVAVHAAALLPAAVRPAAIRAAAAARAVQLPISHPTSAPTAT